MNRFCRLGALLGFIMVSAAAPRAAEVEGLYAAAAAVADQSDAQRVAAQRQAFSEVLIKVSGSPDVLQAPTIKEALGESQRWVQQFGYRGTTGGPDALQLWVRFDPDAVDALLRGNGLPLWGRDRPKALAWVALDADGGRRLINADEDPALARAMAEPARRRGLEVELPLNDLEDQRRVSSADVWGDFAEPIRAASERYHAQLVLVGRLERRSPANWVGRWTLHGVDQDRWEESAKRPEELLRKASRHYAELMRRRYAPSGGGGDAMVFLQVGEVYYFTDYLRVMRHLESVGQLDGPVPVRFDADRMLVTGTLRGGPEGLRRSLALGGVLIPASPPAPPSGEAGEAAVSDTGDDSGVPAETLYYALRR